MEGQIINKVEKSGLIQIDMESWLDDREVVLYDIGQNLFQGLVIREKDFRSFIKENDWSVYENKHVGIICSTDAIIPMWAYMLLVVAIESHATSVIVGNKQDVTERLLLQKINRLNGIDYLDAKLVVKGCSGITLSPSIYAELTRVLLPHVKSIMFGEPCSTVPVYKKRTGQRKS